MIKKSQVISQKSQVRKIVLFSVFCLLSSVLCLAQDNPEALREEITAADNAQEAFPLLEELKSFYFAENQYNEFAEFLNSLKGRNKSFLPQLNYFLGLTRYRQLRYLEETQDWNGYFSQGDLYRRQLADSLKEAIAATSAADSANIYSRLTLWQYYEDQGDPLSAAVLPGLTESVAEYANTGQEISVIKTVADTFLSYRQRPQAKQVYTIYVARLLASDINDSRLKEAAYGFYQEDKLELSEQLYEAYLERIPSDKKTEILALLKEIAARFAYQDRMPYDAAYAESIFKKIEELGGMEAFDEELIYLRAFNLEKAKDFSGAKEFYLELAGRNPEGRYFDEAVFKAGVISAYFLGEINSAKTLFEGLALKEALSPQVISSFYQLGLLSQWEGDSAAAKGFYSGLIDKAGEDFSDTVMPAHKRLQEIEEGRPIEYNLRIFLEAALKEPAAATSSGVQLLCRPYNARKEEEVLIEPDFIAPRAGCMRLELSYLWSGDTGAAEPSEESISLSTSYDSPGTKIINLVLLSPAGIAGHCLDFVDVY